MQSSVRLGRAERAPRPMRPGEPGWHRAPMQHSEQGLGLAPMQHPAFGVEGARAAVRTEHAAWAAGEAGGVRSGLRRTACAGLRLQRRTDGEPEPWAGREFG